MERGRGMQTEPLFNASQVSLSVCVCVMHIWHFCVDACICCTYTPLGECVCACV